jgi:DNA-binding GntR family transcriptional regulator
MDNGWKLRIMYSIGKGTAMVSSADSPIAVQGLQDAVYGSIRSSILNGSLPPGSRLNQGSLAARFGVSRVPVREAMSRLQAEGLVVLRPRRGFTVSYLTVEEIIEVFELRMVVEEHATSVATWRRAHADIDAVGEILTKMEALDRSDPDLLGNWADHNREFHARLIASAGRSKLSEVALQLGDMVEPYIRLRSTRSAGVDLGNNEHRAIFEAFASGDADKAGRMARLHCDSVLKRLLKETASSGGEKSGQFEK